LLLICGNDGENLSGFRANALNDGGVDKNEAANPENAQPLCAHAVYEGQAHDSKRSEILGPLARVGNFRRDPVNDDFYGCVQSFDSQNQK